MMNIKCLNSNYTNNQLLINRTNSQKMLDIIVAGLTNGFLKFLARFSGKFLFQLFCNICFCLRSFWCTLKMRPMQLEFWHNDLFRSLFKISSNFIFSYFLSLFYGRYPEIFFFSSWILGKKWNLRICFDHNPIFR
jgi:hypothetical protein